MIPAVNLRTVAVHHRKTAVPAAKHPLMKAAVLHPLMEVELAARTMAVLPTAVGPADLTAAVLHPLAAVGTAEVHPPPAAVVLPTAVLVIRSRSHVRLPYSGNFRAFLVLLTASSCALPGTIAWQMAGSFWATMWHVPCCGPYWLFVTYFLGTGPAGKLRLLSSCAGWLCVGPGYHSSWPPVSLMDSEKPL